MPRFMRNFESALETAYNRWIHDYPLADIEVIDQGEHWMGVRQVL
jgi:hypothetical protein